LKVSTCPGGVDVLADIVGHANPEISTESVVLPLELFSVPTPVAGRQSPTLDIGSDALLVSTLNAKLNEPLLKVLVPTTV
jgi:hypothetical protein